MSALRIACIGGDGTGPEVTAEALKVLRAVAGTVSIELDVADYDLGGDRYLRTGEILPDGVLENCATSMPSSSARSAIPTWRRGFSKKACCWSCGFSWTNTSTCAP